MGDGMEILLWLAIMAVVGIRGAAQARKRAEQEPEQTDGELPVVRPSLPEARSDARVRTQTASSRRPEQARRGVLQRMMEYAAEMERQAEARQAEARQAPDPQGGTGRSEGREDGDRTVLVPGRRVRPSPLAERVPRSLDPAGPPSVAAGSQPVVRSAGMERVGEPIAVADEPDDSPRRARRPALSRLERYPASRRAIILSEILGPPRGLQPPSAARSWGDDL